MGRYRRFSVLASIRSEIIRVFPRVLVGRWWRVLNDHLREHERGGPDRLVLRKLIWRGRVVGEPGDEVIAIHGRIPFASFRSALVNGDGSGRSISFHPGGAYTSSPFAYIGFLSPR